MDISEYIPETHVCLFCARVFGKRSPSMCAAPVQLMSRTDKAIAIISQLCELGVPVESQFVYQVDLFCSQEGALSMCAKPWL